MSKVIIEVNGGCVSNQMEGTGGDFVLAAAVLVKQIANEAKVPVTFLVNIIGKIATEMESGGCVKVDLAALRKELEKNG